VETQLCQENQKLSDYCPAKSLQGAVVNNFQEHLYMPLVKGCKTPDAIFNSDIQTPIQSLNCEKDKPVNNVIEEKIYLSQVPRPREMKEHFSFFTALRFAQGALITDDYLKGKIYKGDRKVNEDNVYQSLENREWISFLSYKAVKLSSSYRITKPLATISLFIADSIEELPSYAHRLWRPQDRKVVKSFFKKTAYQGKVAEMGKLASANEHFGYLSRVFRAVLEEAKRHTSSIFCSTSGKHARNYEKAGINHVFWETLHESPLVNNREVVASIIDLTKIEQAPGYKFLKRYPPHETFPWDNEVQSQSGYLRMAVN